MSRPRSRSRPSRGSVARRSSRPTTTTSPWPACYAYNDWMVEEWCGDSDGALIPLCIIPLWDVEARRRRDPPQRRPGRAGGALQRDPAEPRPAVHPHRRTGTRSSRPARRPAPSSACTSARRRRCRRRRPTRRRRSAATLSFNNAMASLSDFLFSGLLVRFPDAEARLLARARSAGCPTSSSGPTTCGRSIGPGAGCRTWCPSRRRPTTTARSTAASSATSTASTSLEQVGVDNITFETDYPHTDSTWPNTLEVAEDMMGHLPAGRRATRSCGATPSACWVSTWTEGGDGGPRRPERVPPGAPARASVRSRP